MKSITLFTSRGLWIARFDDPEVIAVMGTCDIPTPFTAEASAGTVAEEIGRRIPAVHDHRGAAMLKRIWRFFFAVPRTPKPCRKHWFSQGIGEGPCPVCGTVVTFSPRLK